MSKIKSLVAKFLSFTLMSSSCFAVKMDALHISKSGKSVGYSGRKIKNYGRLPNSKVRSRKVRASHNGLSLSKRNLNSSLKSGNLINKPVVDGVVNTSGVSKSDNKFLGRKRHRGEKVKKSDNGSVQKNANFQVKNDSSVFSTKQDVVNHKGNTFLHMAKRTGALIKKNPKKSASAFVGAVAMGTFVGDKINNSIEKDDVVFEKFKEYVKRWKIAEGNLSKWPFTEKISEREKKFIEDIQDENLIFLLNVSKTLHSIITQWKYSLFRTAGRRIKDMFLIRGAVTRQRKSVKRFMKNGKGTCWEAAQIFDFCCRKTKT